MSLRVTVAMTLLVVVLSGTASAQGGSDTAAPAQAQIDAPATCDRHELSTLYKCILHDLRKVARKDSLTWLAAGAAVAAGSLLLDDEVTKAVSDPESHAILAAGDPLGDGTVQFAAPLALYVAARATDHADAAGVAVTMLRTQVVNGILTRSLKIVPRARPYQETGIVGKGSFPSGHTSAAFATATVLHRRWGWRGGLPAYAVATYIGISRLERVHYLSDVTFGAALGIASGFTVNLPARGTAIVPILSPGVAGVRVRIR